MGRNVAETLRQIAAFQLVRESKGTQATPQRLAAGKAVLTPGEDLVGKGVAEMEGSMAFD